MDQLRCQIEKVLGVDVELVGEGHIGIAPGSEFEWSSYEGCAESESFGRPDVIFVTGNPS